MISDSDEEIFQQVRQSQIFARLIIAGIVAYFISILWAAIGLSQNNALIVFSWLVFTLLLGIALSVFAILLARRSREKYSAVLVWAGIILIVVGIWSDVLATIYATSDLAIEGNSIIIFLRENGFSIWLQYATGGIAQLVLTVAYCALWAAFARHLSLYRKTLLAMRPQSLLEFFKAALGGATYFLKTQRIRVSRSYRLVWWIILLNSLPFTRLVLGLGWLGVLPSDYRFVQLVGWMQIFIALIVWLSWLANVYFSERNSLRADPELTLRANQALLKGCLVAFISIFIGACALSVISASTYLWATREPQYLEVSINPMPNFIPTGSVFSVTYHVKNVGEEDIKITSAQATFWNEDETRVAENFYFIISPQQTAAEIHGPQTDIMIEEKTLAPGETLTLDFYFLATQAGDALLKTSVYSGWREKMAEPILIRAALPAP